jgi:hypothetical protein
MGRLASAPREEASQHDRGFAGRPASCRRDAENIAQARALKEHARKGGLRFEAYCRQVWPNGFSLSLSAGSLQIRATPSSFIFVEHKDLEPHADLRQASLKRSLDATRITRVPAAVRFQARRSIRTRNASPLFASESPCSAFGAPLQIRMKATRHRMQRWMSVIKS